MRNQRTQNSIDEQKVSKFIRKKKQRKEALKWTVKILSSRRLGGRLRIQYHSVQQQAESKRKFTSNRRLRAKRPLVFVAVTNFSKDSRKLRWFTPFGEAICLLSEETTMLIHKKDIKRLRVAHTVLAESPIKSLEFLYNGEQLVYNTNRQIHILSLFDSGPTSKSFTAKGGAGLCKFFDPRFVLHSTTTGVDILKLLDLDRNSYKIYYRGNAKVPTNAFIHFLSFITGHAKEITSIDSSEKLIVSGSEDSSVRIWEPKVTKALKVMKFPSSTLVAFHPKGDDFAVAYNSSTIEIFSTRNFDEPSSKAQYKQVDGVEWTGIKFSENGNLLLVTTNAELILIFDVVTKEELHNLRGEQEAKQHRQMFHKFLQLPQTTKIPAKKPSARASLPNRTSSSAEASADRSTFGAWRTRSRPALSPAPTKVRVTTLRLILSSWIWRQPAAVRSQWSFTCGTRRFDFI